MLSVLMLAQPTSKGSTSRNAERFMCLPVSDPEVYRAYARIVAHHDQWNNRALSVNMAAQLDERRVHSPLVNLLRVAEGC